MSEESQKIAVTPFDVALHKATQFHVIGKRQEAENIYLSLLKQQPTHAFLNFAYGTLLTDEENRVGLSIPLLKQSVAADPTNVQAWNNLAAAYKSCWLHEESVEALNIALDLDPRNPAVYANYSGLYINEGCPEKCLPWTERGMLIDPDIPQLHNHRALALLELGRWSEAWPEWEWRIKLPGWFQRPFPERTKPWHGQPVKTLALSGEQGIGDEILFASIIPEILPLVKDRLFIECTQRLQTLFERTFPSCKTYPSHQELLFHEHDIEAHLQLGSLPRLFRWKAEECPGTPFLKPDPVQVNEFRARLTSLGPPPYVGLAWQGGTNKTHRHARAITLQSMKPIAEIAGATFVSVQYGQVGLEAAHAGLPHWADAVIDFDRHTALIAACDLIISVCQTAVHQAGALGIPCWCLTPVKVAWRYGVTGGERMFWWNSVKLLRQEKEGEWDPVIQRAAKMLLVWMQERTQERAA